MADEPRNDGLEHGTSYEIDAINHPVISAQASRVETRIKQLFGAQTKVISGTLKTDLTAEIGRPAAMQLYPDGSREVAYDYDRFTALESKGTEGARIIATTFAHEAAHGVLEHAKSYEAAKAISGNPKERRKQEFEADIVATWVTGDAGGVKAVMDHFKDLVQSPSPYHHPSPEERSKVAEVAATNGGSSVQIKYDGQCSMADISATPLNLKAPISIEAPDHCFKR